MDSFKSRDNKKKKAQETALIIVCSLGFFMRGKFLL